MAKRIDYIIEDIKEQYLESDNNIPWIIGFSGGKDSTVVLTLVWKALLQIKEEKGKDYMQRSVYVVNNDTLVENPIISDYVIEVLEIIKRAAIQQDLPLKVQVTFPKLEDSFWISFLGKGYPVPNNTFRWCTERLKIKPTTQFILDKIDQMGEAIVIIGTRKSESATRAKTISKHEIKGKRLSKHPLNPNAYTYAPIKELYLEEVWYILRNEESPWGYDNSKLFQIYSDASADDYECPTVITDKTQPSCGQSRFGCWVCTVVKEDKSMTALVKRGNEWMKPLLDYRDEMVEGRNISENRSATRRNGQQAVDSDGHNLGNYTFEYRVKMLAKLLNVQKQIQETHPHMELISNQELVAIQINWYRDGYFHPKVTDIFNEVYNRKMPFENMQYQERLLLEKICKDYPDDYHLINDLVSLHKNKTILMNNNGLQGDIEKRLDNYIKEKQCL
ncbi:DNA phosphorothioation system sulfurtransferase DndC [Parabacteroides sp. AD58]|uniref:DNA phosphorothioation system sulfurtransferase DndC n=1 Tax=Parabacteroides absconsus TaxID=2951805 RepID=A0ABZ2ITS6_9BACT|nr:DNA phosphorothioation system sulfurtransferase DndC [Parabacteroides sp. AD58]MCM6903350.1 DNA phosphorothioation system sulfurtransferase DndC [Parabacteroides sp. AD58]